jgi:hypothetical protein
VAELGGPEDPENEVSAEITSFVDSQLWVVTTELQGSVALSDSFGLGLQWPMAFGAVAAPGVEEISRLQLGNPTPAAHLRWRTGGVVLSMSPGVTIPLATLPDGDPSEAQAARWVYSAALGVRGLWNPWLWFPDTLSIVLPMRIDVPIGEDFTFGTDVAMGVGIPTAGDDRDLEFGGQVGLDFARRLGRSAAGASLRAVWTPSFEEGNLQLSLEPFLRLHLGAQAFTTARFTLNLNRPYGFSFEQGGVWGLSLGAGATF